MLRLKVTPVVGLPQFTGWSQVAESSVSVSVRLIFVYSISGKHAGNVGRDINEKISDFYFYDVEQFHDFLSQLIQFVHSNECKIYFSCAALSKTKSVFATYGGTVFLKRGEKSGKIITSEFEIKLIEGNYVETDTFVLTTLQADQFLNEVQLKFQQGYDTDVIITSVVPGLHAQEDSSLSALVFISKDDQDTQSNKRNQVDEEPVFQVEEELETIPVEDELVDVELGEHESEKLADVQFEVDFAKPPEKAVTVFNKVKTVLFLLLKRSQSLFFLLFLFLKKVFVKIVNFLKRVDMQAFLQSIKNIKTDGIGSLFKQKKQYMLDARPTKKGVWKFLVVVVVILLLLGFVGFISYSRNKERERVQLLLDPIESSVVDAQSKFVEDPITTREVIAQAIEKIEVLEKGNEKSSAIGLLQEKKTSWNQYLESISGSEELQELDIFYDLRLVKSDFIASGIDSDENTILVYDKDMKQVLLLDQSSKKVFVRDFSDKETMTDMVLQGQTVFALVDGIYKFPVSFDGETEATEVRELGDSNRNATLIEAYDRFVYVVNPEKRNVYRYSESEDGYSDPVGWMKSATGLKYEEIRSIAVDGDVWLTTSDGQLKKFTSGREESLTLRGLEVPFTQDIYVYTNEDLENVYVLDPANNRIVFFSKTGDFIQEFKSVSLGAASGLTVSESLGKIFVVSGSIIYGINL